jgi:hypothetical protein
VFLLERGVYRARTEKVEPAMPAVLSGPGGALDAKSAADAQRPVGSTGRRWALAKWFTRPNSRAAALLARVTANRIWQQHFGVGIVATPDNLGYSGAAPSHRELLEYLASELVASGWSVKHLQRLIVTSAVYRQSSRGDASAAAADPDNRLLSHFPLRRLDADSLRDAMLAASGEIDLCIGGRYVPTRQTGVGEVVVEESTAGARRRSVYLQQRRTQMPSLLSVFDAPSVVVNCTRRSATTIPLQSLSLLNSEFSRNRAAALASRIQREVGDEAAARIERAFRLTVGRPPTADESAAAVEFMRTQPSQYPVGADVQRLAWIDFCQMLMASNAFLYVE